MHSVGPHAVSKCVMNLYANIVKASLLCQKFHRMERELRWSFKKQTFPTTFSLILLYVCIQTVQSELAFLGQQPFQAFVSQGVQSGETIYQFFVIDTQLLNEEQTEITFSSPQTNSLPFVLVPGSGQLLTIDVLVQNEYNFTVEASSETASIATQIIVHVIPLSDTLPRFEYAQYDVEVLENLPIRNAISVTRAFSLSLGATTQRYSIVVGNTNNDLSINSNSGILRVDRSFDRERTASYFLTVRYVDDFMSVDAAVCVTVLDVNDNSPQFSQPLYNVSIAETAAIGTSILTLSATDLDISPNDIITYHIDASANGTFTLDPQEGTLKTLTMLDYERQPKYQFRVTAVDGGIPPRSSIATVLVNLINIDDECPRFENPVFIEELAYDVTGTPPAVGTEILTVMATDPDRFSEVTYSIVSTNDVEHVLLLDSITGVVSLARTDIDPRGQYTLNVTASDQNCTLQSFVRVEIGIGNVNDHSPEFQTNCAAFLSENPPLGTAVVTLHATDDDIGYNGLVTYSLLSGTDVFAIDATSGVVRTNAPPGSFDRETQSSFQVGVTASDGGNRQDYCLLIVTLMDVNDNPPQISLSHYSISLARGSQPGSFVVQVTAVDPDVGANGRISYSIETPSDSLPFPFQISSESGVILTTEAIQPTVNGYMFNVFATDLGEEVQLTSTATVSISLTDGDFFPVFDQFNYTGSVCENAQFQTIVLNVSASSSMVDELIVYEIIAGLDYRSNLEEAFVIRRKSNDLAEIRVGSNVIIDFERLAPNLSFQFFVQARNAAGGSLVPVEIVVNDIDDNSPRFLSDISITLPENEPIGTTVAQVQAVDLDSGTNGEVMYRLASASSSPYFNITSEGVIVSSHVFDFESSSQLLQGDIFIEAYNPNPLATDPVCTFQGFRDIGTAIIHWTILDQNDNPPAFQNSLYFTQVPENKAIQSKIYKLNVSDPDVSDRGRLRFSITSGNDGSFGIDSDYIVLTTRLDYEAMPIYNLVIQVTDGVHSGQDCPGCVATVRITVTNVDDEPPVFSSLVYEADVIENAPVGSSVLTLTATDIDSANILYELRGLAEGKFTVDQSGVITVSGEIDREEFPRGELVFLAFAEGGSLATADIVITILDVNDYVPRFTGLFRGRVEENTPPGEVGLYVGEVRAVDLDSGENGSISYSLVSGEDAGFTINSKTGVITAHAQYDREVSPSYTITVEAKDNGTHVQLSSESLFLVEIGDVNDNKPFFPFSYMFARVFENSPLGTSVLVIPAIDPDNGTNATVTYTLESFSPSEVKFELNPTNGEVTVAGSLDYEIPQHRFYTLTFSLRDARFVSDSRGTLQIELLDVNDNTPSIDLVIQTNSNLQETFPPGAVVAMVTASDQDTGINAELVYEISMGNENGDFQLSVEGNVANIVTINQFDYESRSSYTLIVSVSDRGTPQREASTELVFNIIDVNDQPPMFTDSVYSVSIPENSNVTESLLQVEAVDRDTGSGGLVVRYEILNGNEGSWFSLSSGGVLRSLVVFDREERSSYSLTIIAFDGGAVPLNGTARIEVTIADVNDNPSFNGGHLTVFVYALNGHAAIGDIAPLYFIDPDIDDQFIACIIQAQSHSGLIFDIDASTCTLQLLVDNPPVDIYTFQRVLGRDGVHATVITGATIVVEHLASSELPRDHLVTLTLNASSEAFFQERLNETFPVELAGVLGIQEENLHLITVQPGHFLPDSTVDVTFTVRDRNGIYLEPTEIIQQLYLNRDSLAPGNHSILDLPVDVCVNEPCQNQAACRNTMTIVGTDKVSSTREFVLLAPKIEFGYECVCVPGTSGEHCEINFNDCYSNPCLYGAQCTDEVNVFSCDCPAGRGGQDCSFISDRCITSPCLNGGSCMTGIDSYICDCLPGYYGTECQYHYFRPSSFCTPNNPCQNGAECSAGRDSFTCVCLLGFMGDFCETETQLQGGCIGNPCYNGSTCNATDQGPVCMCSTGFVGPNCQWPLNNCELGLCLNGASCEQGLYGSYRCACMPGFTGENCDLPIPACSSNPCLNQGRCLDNQDGTHTCQCVPGYYGDNCEFSIHPVDLCLMDVCSVDSNCTSGRDSYTCSCDEGFSGPDCSILGEVGSNVQPCSVNPCLYGGECVDDSTQQAGYSCRCAVGFTGADCEDNINDCSTSPCINGGMCTDGINGYICSCPSHLTGNECQIYCPEGYSGMFCQTPVSQCAQNPCENGSTCVEEAAGFVCVCPPSHTGTRCEVLNNCADNMCSNGGTCIDLEGGGFNCDCSQDFKGEKCELLTVSFSGSQGESSYRAFDSLEIRGQGRIEFEFATVDDNGLLLYNTQYQNGESKDFIAVEIVDGVLRVAISHGNGDSSVLVMSNYVVVTDGLWHRVSIDTRGKVCCVV